MENTTTNERKQKKAIVSSNWMIELAGILFWTILIVKFLLLQNNLIDSEFTNFIILHALPITGVLAFFGIRKEQKAILALLDDKNTAADCNL